MVVACALCCLLFVVVVVVMSHWSLLLLVIVVIGHCFLLGHCQVVFHCCLLLLLVVGCWSLYLQLLAVISCSPCFFVFVCLIFSLLCLPHCAHGRLRSFVGLILVLKRRSNMKTRRLYG